MLGNLPKIVWLGRCKAWIQHRGLFHLAVSHDLSPVSFTFYDFRRKSEVSRLYLVLLSEGLLSDLLEDTQLANGRSRIRQRPPHLLAPAAGFSFPSLTTKHQPWPRPIRSRSLECRCGPWVWGALSRCDPKAVWDGWGASSKKMLSEL